jgi:hypothetical protein
MTFARVGRHAALRWATAISCCTRPRADCRGFDGATRATDACYGRFEATRTCAAHLRVLWRRRVSQWIAENNGCVPGRARRSLGHGSKLIISDEPHSVARATAPLQKIRWSFERVARTSLYEDPVPGPRLGCDGRRTISALSQTKLAAERHEDVPGRPAAAAAAPSAWGGRARSD